MDDVAFGIEQNPNFADISNLMFITITADGTRYAYMINDITAFLSYFYQAELHQSDYTSYLFSNKDKNRGKYYYGTINPTTYQPEPPKILENSMNKEQDLKYFMEIADNAGLNVFEIDANFNTFTRITKIENEIIRTKCN